MILSRGIENHIRRSIGFVILAVAMSMAFVNYNIALNVREAESDKLEKTTKDFILKEIVSSFQNHLTEFVSLSESTILITALLDSHERENYLFPLLRLKSRTDNAIYNLLDYKKRNIARTNEISQSFYNSTIYECDRNQEKPLSISIVDNFFVICSAIKLPSDNLPIGYLFAFISIKNFLEDAVKIDNNVFKKDITIFSTSVNSIDIMNTPIYFQDDQVIMADVNLSAPLDATKLVSFNNLFLIGIGFSFNIGLGYLLSRYLAKRISNPVIKLSEAAISFSKGNINFVDRSGMVDELQNLADILEATYSEQTLIRNKLQALVNFDQLTESLSRIYFHNSFDTILKIAQRNNTGISLLYVDLDRFKSINDTHGHDAGDEVLRSIVKRMKMRLRSNDLIGRRGGDEFVVGLYPVKNRAEVELVCNDLIALISQPISIRSDLQVSVGASVGISMFPDHGLTVDILEKNADIALYRAKYSGGNCFVWFDG